MAVEPGVCAACGVGFETGSKYKRCDYCGLSPFQTGEHVHQLGIRVDGLAKCVGAKVLGCTYEDYDSQWGAGIFNDWPMGHHKPYGA